ncbi:MAG: UTRA domain-containing protein [Olsenella umbonata]|nr:UTRA domain-containing protein [Parafannyhessea umbonata]
MRGKIRNREWRRGRYIPSEADLMAQYGVSRGTVRKAIGTLVAEGLLVSRKGSGTVVADGGISRPGNARSFSFAASLRDGGVRYTTQVLQKDVLPAPAEVAKSLQVEPGEPALFMRRVRSVGGRPVVCQESWSNLEACPGLEQADFTTESLFDAVERCSGRKIALSHMHYSSCRAGAQHAACLACGASDPVMVLEQNIELADSTPIEWSLTWLGPNQSIVGVSMQSDGFPGPLELDGIRTRPREGAAVEDDATRALRRRLDLDALAVRRGVVEWGRRYMGSPLHFGGALSMAEIVAVLLDEVMHTGRDGTPWDERDRLIVSKAHASVALYPMMLKRGLISQDDVDRGLFGPDARIFKHPERDPQRGFEISGGSLGMGLGYAAGLALSLRRKRLPGRVFCVVGDGECDEGSVWESAALIGHKRLANLTVVVDANGMQLDGPTAQILDNGPINRKFTAFGFDVVEVDGHDVIQLADALRNPGDRPRAVVARTRKGHGLSFAEGHAEWHDKALTEELYQQAMRELGAREEAIRNE